MNETPRNPDELSAFLASLPDDRWLRIMRYREIEARGVNPKAMSAADALLTARADEAMPENERQDAQKRLFNYVLAATKEGNDQVQVYADRIWGRLSPDDKRQLAVNSTVAPSIVMEVMRNDPVLASKIAVNIDQTPAVRGIETYQGNAGTGGMRLASLRDPDSAREAQARQYADLRLSGSDVTALTSIGMDRVLFDRYLRDGFTQAQILSGARDANALGFRGRDDIDIAMNAPPELRAAALAIQRAETPEAREAARRHYQEVRERLLQQYPPGDPHRRHIDNFDHRIQTINGMFVASPMGSDAMRALGTAEHAATTIQSLGRRDAEALRAAVTRESTTRAATHSEERAWDATAAALGLRPASNEHAEVEPAAAPDTKIAAGEIRPGDGTTPDPAAKTKTARAMILKPPDGLA